jgi:hypothetical protein
MLFVAGDALVVAATASDQVNLTKLNGQGPLPLGFRDKDDCRPDFGGKILEL